MKNNTGGIQSRIGKKFSKEIEEIKDGRLRNGKSKYRVSSEKITNMITKHNEWTKIKEDLILVEAEVLENANNEE